MNTFYLSLLLFHFFFFQKEPKLFLLKLRYLFKTMTAEKGGKSNYSI